MRESAEGLHRAAPLQLSVVFCKAELCEPASSHAFAHSDFTGLNADAGLQPDIRNKKLMNVCDEKHSSVTNRTLSDRKRDQALRRVTKNEEKTPAISTNSDCRLNSSSVI
jgi:hypothetical protein